jgi:hypothetical protein
MSSAITTLQRGDTGIKVKRVIAKIQQTAVELNLLESYLNTPVFVQPVEPLTPENATADNGRKYQMDLDKYTKMMKNIGILRSTASELLSEDCHEYLCILMGKDTAEVLTARDLVKGLKEHMATMTEKEADELLSSLNTEWNIGKSLTEHFLQHASVRASLMAGGKAPADAHSKENLWRTLTRLKEMPVYATLRETLRASIIDDKISLAAHVAMAVKVLQDAQYTELNTVAAEKALVAKDSTDAKAERKAAARKKELAAMKKQYENTPVGDNCPIHPDVRTPHTWGECNVNTGKRFEKRSK